MNIAGITPLASSTVHSNAPRFRRKLVVVGTGGTGKTSLLMVFARQSFPTEYVPTVFENLTTEMVIDKKIVDLALWDTAGQEDYDRLRPLSYPDTDVVLLCYAANNRESFEDLRRKWDPEVEHFCENVPKILVALKSDLRDQLPREERTRCISTEEGQEMAYKIGAARFLECSAKLRLGTDSVFEAAVTAIFERERKLAKRRRRQTIKRIATRCNIM
jgi:small GTP-binding protein